jgi:hypothetical protein
LKWIFGTQSKHALGQKSFKQVSAQSRRGTDMDYEDWKKAVLKANRAGINRFAEAAQAVEIPKVVKGEKSEAENENDKTEN